VHCSSYGHLSDDCRHADKTEEQKREIRAAIIAKRKGPPKKRDDKAAKDKQQPES